MSKLPRITTEQTTTHANGMEQGTTHLSAHLDLDRMAFPSGSRRVRVLGYAHEDKAVTALLVTPPGHRAPFVNVETEVREGSFSSATQEFLTVEQARELRDQLTAALEEADLETDPEPEENGDHLAYEEREPELDLDWSDQATREALAGDVHPFPEVR